MNTRSLAPCIHAYTARVAAESLKGQLLIAAPVLVDPNFRRSVVLIIEHSDAGALGVVLNRPTELPVADAVPELADLDGGYIFAGGPVQPQAVIALAEYSGPPPDGAVCGPIAPIGVESDMDTLAEQVTRVRVYAGYSGWGEGQLDDELREEAWFVEPALPRDVFCADADRLWNQVLERMGGPYRLLARMPEDPAMN
jgi:putative transcriptional regulator